MSEKQPIRLGDLLLGQGIISEDQLNIALIEQKTSGDQLGRALIRLGFVSEEIIRDQLGQSLGQKTLDLKNLIPDDIALSMVSQTDARQLQVLPISFDEEKQQLVLCVVNGELVSNVMDFMVVIHKKMQKWN